MIIKNYRRLFCILLFIIFLVTLPKCIVFAQESISATDVYTVKGGDTLWEISNRYLNDPFLWPSLWQKNPHIKDPHWIFPGEIINLKSFMTSIEPSPTDLQRPSEKEIIGIEQKEAEVPTPVLSPPYAPQYIVTQERVDSCSYILPAQIAQQRRTSEGWVRIIDSREEKVNLSYLDHIVIDMGEGAARPGDVFTLFSLKNDLEGLKGYSMITILGQAKIKEIHPEFSVAQIIKSYAEVTKGDFAKPYTPMHRPILHLSKINNLDGTVLSSEGQKDYLAQYDLIFLNIGSENGLEPGNPLEIYRFDEVVNPDSKDKTRKILQPLGELVVLRVEEVTATALVTKSVQPIKKGDRVRVSLGQ